MEVVGVTAAVGSLGTFIFKFGRKVRKIAKEAGTVGVRIERTSLLFTISGATISSAERSLDDRCKSLTDTSVVMAYMREKNLFEDMKRFSRMIRQDIRAREEEIGTLTSLGFIPSFKWDKLDKFIISLKWDKLEQRLISLLPMMECHKSNVAMTLKILTLEAISQRNKVRPSKEYEKEIESLKIQIVEHIDTIRYLKRNNRDLLKMMSHSHAEGSRRQSRSPEPDQLRVLCHLGQSFVEREAIPTTPPDTFSFKEARRLRRYRQREFDSNGKQRNATPAPIGIPYQEHPAGPRVHDPILSASSSYIHIRTRLQNRRQYVEDAARGRNFVHTDTTRSIPYGDRGRNIDPPESHHINTSPRRSVSVKAIGRSTVSSEQTISDASPTLPSTIAMNRSSSRIDPANLAPQHSGETARSTAQEQENPDSLSKQNYIPRLRPTPAQVRTEPTPPQTPTSPSTLSPSSSQRSRYRKSNPLPSLQTLPSSADPNAGNRYTGYMVTKAGKRIPFEAHIDRQVAPRNLITLEYATELGVDIQEHTRRTLRYRDIEIESVGKATLSWSTLPDDDTLAEPSTLEVIVCQELPGHALIFGQWFTTAWRDLRRTEEDQMEELRAEEGFNSLQV